MIPTHDSPKPDSETIAKARAEAVQLAGYFAEVFGHPRVRTAAQKQILSHLAKCAGGGEESANSYRFEEARDGISIIAAGIHRDGARSILRVIERQVAKAAEGVIKPGPKKSAKR